MMHRWPRIIALVGLIAFFVSMTVVIRAQESPAPRVWAITADTSTPTSFQFVVRFSEAVTGVDSTDFSTSGDDRNATITAVRSIDAAANTYVVDVTLAGPSAQLALNLFDDDSIVNVAGLPLGGLGVSNGNAVSAVVTIETPPIQPQAIPVHAEIDAPLSGPHIVGYYTSMALTTANVAIITYFDATNGDLKLAICNDVACTSPTISTLDSAGNVGYYTSIALTTASVPVISYYDDTNGHLKLAVCNNAACTTPTISTLDSSAEVGSDTSIALTTANVPVISYHDSTNADLKLAVCNDAACTSPTLSTLDSTGWVGGQTSIALTTANLPVISYYALDTGDLKLAVCNDAACTTPTISTLDSTGHVGRSTSIALTAANVPIISYIDRDNSDLKLAVCNNAACSSPAISTIDSDGVGDSSSLALTTANIPVITYYATWPSLDLKLAVCNDATCVSPAISTIDSIGSVGFYPFIALRTSNVPIISYYDDTNGRLKLYTAPVEVDDGQPNSFTTSTPTDNQIITTTSTTLNWNASMNASSYHYCHATSIAACTTWVSTSTTSASLTELAHNTTYYWQVRATNTSGTRLANGDSFARFTVTLPPTAFAKSSPANNVTKQKTSVTLKWAASTRATSYEYCYALSTTTCTTWKSTGTARTVTVTGLTKNKAYYWQVRAKNAGGTTLSATTFWKFTTAP